MIIGESIYFIYGVFMANWSNFTIFSWCFLNVVSLTLLQKLERIQDFDFLIEIIKFYKEYYLTTTQYY